MPLKKDFKFSPRLIDLANYSLALSHPARIEIIEILQQEGPKSYMHIANQIPLSNSAISSHLRILQRVHLIQTMELPNKLVGYQLHKQGFQLAWGELKQFLLAA